MSTFWGKFFVLAIVIVGVIFGMKFFKKANAPAPPPRTFQDQISEDDAKYRSAPNPTLPVSDQNVTVNKAEEQKAVAEIKFKELTEAENVQAEKLFEMALVSFKQGRLPALTFKKSVDYCRDIIKQFPGTEWEYKARRLLADIPKQDWQKYNITDDEVIVE